MAQFCRSFLFKLTRTWGTTGHWLTVTEITLRWERRFFKVWWLEHWLRCRLIGVNEFRLILGEPGISEKRLYCSNQCLIARTVLAVQNMHVKIWNLLQRNVTLSLSKGLSKWGIRKIFKLLLTCLHIGYFTSHVSTYTSNYRTQMSTLHPYCSAK